MDKETRLKLSAYNMARRAFTSSAWNLSDDNRGVITSIVNDAQRITKELDADGCFADEYGNDGSLEVLLAGSMLGRSFDDDARLTSYDVFVLARRLRDDGLLSQEDIIRSRANALDLKKKEAEKRRKEEADEKRREKDAKDRAAVRQRRAEIEKRRAEIAAEKGKEAN